MEKIMVLYRKLWNFDLLWKKLWYYSKLQLTIVNYSIFLLGNAYDGIGKQFDRGQKLDELLTGKQNSDATNSDIFQ